VAEENQPPIAAEKERLKLANTGSNKELLRQ